MHQQKLKLVHTFLDSYIFYISAVVDTIIKTLFESKISDSQIFLARNSHSTETVLSVNILLENTMYTTSILDY